MKDENKTKDQLKSKLPLRLLIILITAVFITELGIMLLLDYILPPLPKPANSLIDSTLLVIGLFPVLYLFVFRSLLSEITERKWAEEALQKAHDELEKRVKERTDNLKRANEQLEQEIKKRKRTEIKITRQSNVLDAINHILKRALTCETLWELGETCLDVCEKLTGSKFGFIGELNPAGLFDTIAISNPGWDVCKMPGTNKVKSIKNMKISGVALSTIREEKSRIVNDPASHPDRVGTPKGHPVVTSFLGVPLKEADKTIGMIGLGNKESGYDTTDQENVEMLAVVIVEVLRRKQEEKSLREKTQLNQILLDSMPCIALLMRPHTREIIASNEYAAKIKAVPGTKCFSTWGQREDP